MIVQFEQDEVNDDYFTCICDKNVNIADEELLISHISTCQYFMSTSQLYETMPNLFKQDKKDLLLIRATLKSLIGKVNDELYKKGVVPEQNYQLPKLEQNFSTDSSKTKRNAIKCPVCSKSFDPNNDFNKLWYLDSCYHVICKECANQEVNAKFLLNNGCIKCPEKNCQNAFTPQDFINCIGQEKYQELDMKLMLRSQNIVACVKCKEQFGFERGDDNSIVKDPKGNQLSGPELLSYIENRFTCSSASCKTEQCRSCSATPFHVGYTCETFKQVQQKKYQNVDSVSNQSIKFSRTSHKQYKRFANCRNANKGQNRYVQKYTLVDTQPNSIKYSILKPCMGFRNEKVCLPCLEDDCKKGDVNADDYCNICFTEGLRAAPCTKVKCGHIFHIECLIKRIETRWNGPRIVFNYCLCSLCKAWIEPPPDHLQLQKLIQMNKKLHQNIEEKALDRLKNEGRDKDKELKDRNHPFFGKPLEYSMAIYAYYECYKCKNPYFGGLKSCQLNIDDERRQFDKSELVCAQCCPISYETNCTKHGKEYIEFKCKYCCSIALWFCWGNTHFCDPCHRKASQMRNKKPADLQQCKSPEECPLKIKHKPNGEECALGCGTCRMQRFMDESKKQAEESKNKK